MRTILLSFSNEWFQYLNSGKMKFEYRKAFPVEETKVYFYVSRPVMAITGIAHFGPRESLMDWLNLYGNRSEIIRNRILDYMTDCKYAVKIYDYSQTNRIDLQQLRKDIPGFIPPHMYYYIDETPLLTYLEKRVKPLGMRWKFSFEHIDENEICNIMEQGMSEKTR